MGLFDKVIKRSSVTLKEKTALSKRESSAAIYAENSIERAIAAREVSLERCMKIPLSDVAALGGAFAILVPKLKQILGAGNIGNGSIVRVVFPEGIKGKLAALKETGENIGGILVDGGGLAQARLRLVAIDPTTAAIMEMASMLVEINQKIDSIMKTQQEILEFLELDKQAGQQADLYTLSDILNGFKHNWDNAQYRQNHHMKVLDIKQTAEKNVIFYQEQIASAIKGLPAICMDQNVKEAVIKLDKLFRNYRMAVYLFAFSSFLEVMLLGSFRDEYLNQVANKVRKYNACYKNQFAQCHDMIEKFASASVETKIIENLGNVTKTMGKFIASVPILNQGSVDEWLEDSGEKLLHDNAIKTAKASAVFSAEMYTCADSFVESILHVAMVSNHTTDMLFDGATLYLATE